MGTLFYFICALITVAHAIDVDQPVEHAHVHKDDEDHAHSTTFPKIVEANAQFAVNLYKQSASSSHSKNIFFSPLSITIALAMLSKGAKSKTHDQILEGLSYNLTDIKPEEIHNGFEKLLLSLAKAKNELIVNVGNALFLEKHVHLHEDFKEAVQSHYQAEIQTLNSTSSDAAVKQINDYVAKHTNGKIVDLLKELDEETKLVLLNYIYFKGKWEYPFSSDSTTTQKFFVSENVTVEVPMMSQTKPHKNLNDKELSCTVVQLPYKGDAFMLLILPDPGKMQEVEAALSQETLHQWLRQMRESYFELWLPKLSISPSLELNDMLIKMGIKDAFSDHADLSGITEGSPLKVGKAVHKAKLVVDEEGTEAAASTVLEIVPTSIMPVIKFDQPFIFTINSKEDQILFMGKIVNPLEK